jgi:hypothetical protein
VRCYFRQQGQQQLSNVKQLAVYGDCAQMNQDHELNLLLHLAAADTMDLEASLRGQQQQLAQLLSLQLLPCGTAATDASQGAVGQQQREMAAVEKLPLLDLTQPVRITAPPETSGKDRLARYPRQQQLLSSVTVTTGTPGSTLALHAFSVANVANVQEEMKCN